MLGWLTFVNWIGALTLSLLLRVSLRKLSWLILWSFFLVSLLRISISLLYSHAWNIVAILGWCYYSLFGVARPQKRICRAAGPSPTVSLKPLAYCWNVASLNLFYMYYFGKYLSELAELFPLPYSCRSSTRYSDRLHDLSTVISRCYKGVYVNSVVSHTARLWNFLPIECFPLT